MRYLSNIQKFNQANIKQKIHILEEYWDNLNKKNGQNYAFISKINQQLFEDYIKKDNINLPIAFKDNICTTNFNTTCASKMLLNFRPVYDATVVQRSKKLICFGKLNMDEFAMGTTGETSCFTPAKHPLNLDMSPGGSSSGTAVSVAASMVPFALGSDTGGSSRLPAARCGILGMKPTYGSVSRYGLIPYACSLDQIGVCSKYPEDIAYILDMIGGFDSKDLTSIKIPENFFSSLIYEQHYKKWKIGFDSNMLSNIQGEQEKLEVNNLLNLFNKIGIETKQVDLSNIEDIALATYIVLANSEASTNLAKYDGIKFGAGQNETLNWSKYYCAIRSKNFGQHVQNRIIGGHYCLADNQAIKKANRIRSFIIDRLQEIYEQVDCILLPVTVDSLENVKKKDTSWKNDTYSVIANLAGEPAIAFPLSKVRSLPFGMQLQGPRFSDNRLLSIIRRLMLEK